MTDPVEQAIERIRAWGEARDWRGYDPYDALNSPMAPVLTLGTRVGRRGLTQAVKLCPLNLRPLLGIRPERNAKAIGLVASSYARLAAAGDATAGAQAERWLDWLLASHSGDRHVAWGYHFDVQTRFFAYRRGTPNTIATSFVAQALLDAAELLDDERSAEAALSASRFLTSRMLVGGRRRTYFRYLPGADDLIHNANVLACAVLARTAKVLGEDDLLEPGRHALRSSLAAQRADGSWPYAEGPHGAWVDNFHTAYVLESLAHCDGLDPAVGEALERGLDYWERELFLANGTPKYFPDETYPVDAHCYASAIEAWLAVSDRRRGALARARRTAKLLVEEMLDPSGYLWFQRRRLWTSRVPFVRWTTAPSFRALAGLLLVQARHTSPRLDARLA